MTMKRFILSVMLCSPVISGAIVQADHHVPVAHEHHKPPHVRPHFKKSSPDEMAKACADAIAAAQSLVDKMTDSEEKAKATLSLSHAALEQQAITNPFMSAHPWRHKAACLRHVGKAKRMVKRFERKQKQDHKGHTMAIPPLSAASAPAVAAPESAPAPAAEPAHNAATAHTTPATTAASATAADHDVAAPPAATPAHDAAQAPVAKKAAS